MIRGSLSKRLLSLLLSVMLVAETGLSSGITGYAGAESSSEYYGKRYALKAIASLPKNVENQTVTCGTEIDELNLPKSVFGLAIKESLDEAEDSELQDISTGSSVSEIAAEKATNSEASEIASENDTDSEASEKASKSEAVKKATESSLNKDLDFMTDEQKEIIQKLLYSKTKPKIRDLEDATNLDLTGYEIREVKLRWDNDPSFGGEYDPDIPDVYRFEASLKNESDYILYSVEFPTVNVEVTDAFIATDSVTYPVYVKTKNISPEGTLDFELDVPDSSEVKVYNYSFTGDKTERNEVNVDNGKFSLPVEGSDSEYYFTVLSPEKDIQLQILTDGTDYQNSAGTGTDPVTLTEETEDFDLDMNSFMVVGKNSDITLLVKWEDGGRNEASKDSLTGQDTDDLLYLEYSLDKNTRRWLPLDSIAMKKLGYSEEESTIDSPLDLSEKTAVPTSYSYSFKNRLYDTYVERDEDTGKLVTHHINYRIAARDSLKEHYFCSFEDENGNEDENGTVLHNYEAKNFTAKVKWNDLASKNKDGSVSERPSVTEWINGLTLHKILKGDKENSETVKLLPSSETEEGAITVTDTGNDEWNITIRGYGYDKDNYDIHYYLTEAPIDLNDSTGTEGNPIVNRHYESGYKNINNAANITDALYNGGTLVNVLTGETTFEIYSKWLDEADDKALKERPKTSIILYRYANDGTVTDKSRWSNLSPIQDSDYEEIKDPIGSEAEGNPNSLYRLRLPLSGTLDAYNPDGSELIYVGKLKTTGGTSTYETSLYTRDGSNIGLYNKHFILNGETLRNLIKGSISVKAAKTWKAAARQDVSSQVTLSLYKTILDPNTHPSTYDDEKYAAKLPNTIKLEGFTSELQTRSTESVLPKYDDQGNRLYYFPKEERVYTKNKKTGITEEAISFEEEGEKYFLTGDGYRYHQSYSYGSDKTSSENAAASYSDSGNQSVTITNTLVGKTKVLIKKIFSSGLSNHDKERGYAEVSFDIYRNSEKIGSIKRSYKAGSYLHSIDENGIESEREIKDINELYTSFTDEILIDSYDDMDTPSGSGSLPRYDENGAEYTYTAYEQGGIKESGYYPTVHNSIKEKELSYKLKDSGLSVTEKYLLVNVSITNSIGESKHFSVNKVWKDGGDSEGREPVSFVLEHKQNGSWEQIGTEHTIDPSSENYIYVEVPKELEPIYDAWRKDKSSDAFRIRETHVGKVKTSENAVHYYNGDGQTIARDFKDADDQSLYLGHEWEKYEGGKKQSFSSPEDKTDKYGFVRGSSYVYDVLIDDNLHSSVSQGTEHKETDLLNSYYDFTITNKRVGVVYLDIDAHEWLDGYLKEKARPNEITLSVKMGEETYTFTLNEGNGWKDRMGPFKKYDDEGALIDYSPRIVSENGKLINYIYNNRKDDEASFRGAYVLTTKENLNLGSYHTGDVYSFTLKHELKESIVPAVNKFWEDDAGSSGKRPDIVVNLYRTYTDKDNRYHSEQIDKDTYINYDWTTKNKNWWYVNYDPQPRFSPGNYYEYSYYIKEKTASADTHEYVEIGAFPGSPIETGKNAEFSYDSANPGTLLLEDGTETSAAKVTLDKADAWTIVNRKRNERTVSGVKIYENLPKGFRSKDLPKIKLALWRKTSSVDEPVYEYQKGKDPLGQETLILKPEGIQLTTTLGNANESGETSFTFFNSDGTRAEVPKYDDKGHLYTYYIKEVGNKNTEESEDDKLLHHLFELTTSDTLTNGIKAINGYKTDKGYEITFYKKWTVDTALTNEGDDVLSKKSPAITTIKLRLYRYLQDKSGIITGSEEQVNSQESIELSYDPDNPLYSSYTWTGLPYYAPNLKPYIYVVSEYMGENSQMYRKVYSAEVTKSDGDVHLKVMGKNLYELPSGKYTGLLPSGMGRIHHDKNWTGYDTVVRGSYAIDPDNDYRGKGSGTAGLVNVYTGAPEPVEEPAVTPMPPRGTMPSRGPQMPDKNAGRPETDSPEKDIEKPEADSPDKNTEKPENENSDKNTEKPENDSSSEAAIKPVTDETKEPDDTDGTKVPEKTEHISGSGLSGGGASLPNSSGSPSLKITPYKNSSSDDDSGDTSDGNDASLEKLLSSITGIEEQPEITFAEFLGNNMYSAEEPYDDSRAVLEAKRAMLKDGENGSSEKDRSRSPKTGDESRMILHGIGAVLSMIILGSWFTVFRKKKHL